ncbi:MAG TPA: multicopper oxidase domain-containing protein [Candidatus Nitrosopolaris sp.]|nr:multicopper oxidase domain-containing protein [Candidatus Nitrosopolaris sp.]
MINKSILIISTFAVATSLISAIIIGGIPGASFVYAQTFPGYVPSVSPATNHQKVIQYDHQKNCAVDQHTPTDFKTYLTHFACGHVTVLNNGTTLRKFTLIADDFNGSGKPIVISTNTYGLGKPLTSSNQTYKPVIFHAWTFNGTVPGPTMRFTQGDHVQITVSVTNDSKFPHSLHMHSMHPGPIDGMSGLAGMIMPGHSFTYSFVANPVGVYPYHCHMSPVEEHVARGLYGMMIIDPPTPRPHATEMVMMLNSYSYSFEHLNGTGHLAPTLPATMQQMQANLSDVIENSDENNGPDNQFYSVNGMPFGYVGKDSIPLTTGTPYRIYLANMVEFDPVNSFHMHGNMFYYTPSGTTESAKMYTDIVTIGQGDRGMIEFHYNFPGLFMFHSHINHFSDLGWIGFFNVTKSKGNGNVTPE